MPDEFEQGLRIKPYCLLYDNWGRCNFLGANVVWPLSDDSTNKPQSIGEVIAAILTDVWGDGDKIEAGEPQIVGDVSDKPVWREVMILRKTP